MSLQLITFAADTAVQSLNASDAHTGTLAGTVVPFGTVVRFMGVPIKFEAGSLELPDDLSTVKLLIQHDQDRPVGYATAALERPGGLEMIFDLADHPRASALADEARMKLRDGFSVGAEFDEDTVLALSDAMFGEPAEQPITVHGQLREVSAVSLPAFNDARSNASGTVATFAAEPAEITPTAGKVDVDWTEAELAARVAKLIDIGNGNAHPLSRFSSFAEYAQAAYADPDLARFVLADQITTNNPGVIPPGWLSEVKGILSLGRPGVEAFGGARALPDAGMDLNWPYFDGDLTALVGAQATQKSQITSVRVDLKKGTTPIATYAGGSDVSYQLINRSSPAYLQAYLQIMTAAYAICTDNVYVDALAAAAVNGPIWAPATGTADQLRAALFGASAQVMVATGRPASAVLVASDMFIKLGGLAGLWPATYGTNNVSGTADAGTLEISVAGLRVVLDTNLAAGSIIVSNGLASGWHEDGPRTATAEDVAKLGQNVAVWGMGATAIFLPNGVVKLPAA